MAGKHGQEVAGVFCTLPKEDGRPEEASAASGLFSSPPSSLGKQRAPCCSGLSASRASSLHPQALSLESRSRLAVLQGWCWSVLLSGHTGRASPSVLRRPLTWLLAAGGLQSRRVTVLAYLPSWPLSFGFLAKGKRCVVFIC